MRYQGKTHGFCCAMSAASRAAQFDNAPSGGASLAGGAAECRGRCRRDSNAGVGGLLLLLFLSAKAAVAHQRGVTKHSTVHVGDVVVGLRARYRGGLVVEPGMWPRGLPGR